MPIYAFDNLQIEKMEAEKNTIAGSGTFTLASKTKDYFQLIKFTLSFMVVFSLW